MSGRDPRYGAVVLATATLILGVLGSLVADVDQPYPGFFFSADYRIFPVDSVGDREVG